jgi:hypothetical protein
LKIKTTEDYIWDIIGIIFLLGVFTPLIIAGVYFIIPVVFFMFIGKIIDFFQIVLKWFKK